MMHRFDHQHVAVYTGRALQTRKVGFSSLKQSLRRKPQSPYIVCGFFVRAPSFGGADGRASALPVSRKWLPGLLTRQRCRPHLAVSASVLSNRNDLEAIMAVETTLDCATAQTPVCLDTLHCSNWVKAGPVAVLNPASTLHERIAFSWGLAEDLLDMTELLMESSDDGISRAASHYFTRLTPLVAMLDSLGDCTRPDAADETFTQRSPV
jgi:hypothetical protein